MADTVDKSVKKVTITNSAAGTLSPSGFEGASGGGSEQKRGRSRRGGKLQVTANLIGAGTSPGTLVQLQSTHVPGSETSAVGVSSDLTVAGAAIGGSKPVPKIVLSKTKKKSKVLFTAPKPSTEKPVTPHKKTLKKVKMNLKSLTRKLKKANKIRRSATDKSIGDIKKELIKMGLVKVDTTAPDDVLRQIYSDVETMKKRAL